MTANRSHHPGPIPDLTIFIKAKQTGGRIHNCGPPSINLQRLATRLALCGPSDRTPASFSSMCCVILATPDSKASFNSPAETSDLRILARASLALASRSSASSLATLLSSPTDTSLLGHLSLKISAIDSSSFLALSSSIRAFSSQEQSQEGFRCMKALSASKCLLPFIKHERSSALSRMKARRTALTTQRGKHTQPKRNPAARFGRWKWKALTIDRGRQITTLTRYRTR
mmetsp:Transcript_38035/g.74753  ORF Transcript_38035/g.74753 Transcript_38035/m.74753 type:complete len:229 (-) Transcript_38035:2150-2836(-)